MNRRRRWKAKRRRAEAKRSHIFGCLLFGLDMTRWRTEANGTVIVFDQQKGAHTGT